MRIGYRRMVLAASVLATGVALAGAGAAQSRLVRLTFYCPVGAAGPLARVIGDLTDQFNALAPARVEVVPVYAGDHDATLRRVQTAVMAGNPPDVFAVDVSELPALLAMNAVVPLDDRVKKAEGGQYWDDFFPAFRENSVLGGKIWSIPFQRSIPVLYWNREAFRTAGLDPERAPRTWDELREAARRLTIRDGSEVKQWGVTISGGWHDWLFASFVRQNGGWLINPEGTKANLASREAQEALDFWVDLLHHDQVGPPHSAWASAPPDFVAGRTAMLYHSTAVLPLLKQSAPFDFGVAPMPARKSFGAEVGGGNLAVARAIPRERQDAAWRFVEWMTSAENAARWSLASGDVATRRSAYDLPALRAHVEKNPEYLVARDQLKFASARMMARNYQKVREILRRQLDDAVDGKVTPREALETAQHQVSSVITSGQPAKKRASSSAMPIASSSATAVGDVAGSSWGPTLSRYSKNSPR
jgi:sn-glycerol 3-phosphate transport system substrate-binding protein